RGDTMRFARRAFEGFADDPDAVLLWATVTSGGPSSEAALPLLERLPPNTTAGMRGALLAAEILRTLGLNEAAAARVEAAAALAPGAPTWVGARAQAASANEHRDAVIRLREELIRLR